MGFGPAPTILALAIYCVMPLLRGTVAALETAPGDAAEAARAMGLRPGQILREVELPLALPVIAESLRVALVLAVATAAVGALAGASTLGTPIIVGLQISCKAPPRPRRSPSSPTACSCFSCDPARGAERGQTGLPSGLAGRGSGTRLRLS
jgi:osmoprotectant transport system permease protein